MQANSLSDKCKVLFQIKGDYIRIVDAENYIFMVSEGMFRDKYCDASGNIVPEKESYNSSQQYDNKDADEDLWRDEITKPQGLAEPLLSESTTEIMWEIDDGFGNFGFKNKAGKFVIEPQYAYAHEFTCGLAAVNLGRTWYKTVDGKRYYENHYGYINERGQTVIPFAYDEARPFNKYGLAVVSDLDRSYLIDTSGQRISNTETYDFSHYYDYDDRYIEISIHTEEYVEDAKTGLYDTKERKVILEPSVDDLIVEDDDLILIYDRSGEHGASDFHQYYINNKCEILYPWLYGKGFAEVGIPDGHLNTIVSVSKYIELDDPAGNFFENNGKKYDRKFRYGVYSADEEMIIPTEYDKIIELSENLFGCVEKGVVTVIKVTD